LLALFYLVSHNQPFAFLTFYYTLRQKLTLRQQAASSSHPSAITSDDKQFALADDKEFTLARLLLEEDQDQFHFVEQISCTLNLVGIDADSDDIVLMLLQSQALLENEEAAMRRRALQARWTGVAY
jgi:hypothetical protein